MYSVFVSFLSHIFPTFSIHMGSYLLPCLAFRWFVSFSFFILSKCTYKEYASVFRVHYMSMNSPECIRCTCLLFVCSIKIIDVVVFVCESAAKAKGKKKNTNRTTTTTTKKSRKRIRTLRHKQCWCFYTWNTLTRCTWSFFM